MSRGLTPEQRSAFTDALLRFHFEDLNGLGDRLVHADEALDPAGLASARAQCRIILDALRWDPGALERARTLAARPAELPEDLFGAFLVVSALDPEGEGTRALLAAASEPVRRRLALFARSTDEMPG